MHAYLNGSFSPVENVKLHISDLSIQRGYGVFDFCKVHNGHAFFLDQYLDRFFSSASLLHLAVPLPKSDLKIAVNELIKRNKLDLSGVKMILTGGYSTDGYTIAEPNLIMTQQSLSFPSDTLYEKGVEIITFPYVRDLAEAKTINYTMGIWLQKKLVEAPAYDVLYYTAESVSEFPRSNFFAVTGDGKVITPRRNVLKGVTRANVLKLARSRYFVEERDITVQEVMTCSEAFITSTTKRLIPIISVDGTSIGLGRPGRVFAELHSALKTLEEEDRHKT